MTATPGGWDLPYEEDPAHTKLDMSSVQKTGEITALAGSMDVPIDLVASGRLPVLVFRFGVDPFTRKEIQPVALLMDADGLRRAHQLIGDAIEGAIRGSTR